MTSYEPGQSPVNVWSARPLADEPTGEGTVPS